MNSHHVGSPKGPVASSSSPGFILVRRSSRMCFPLGRVWLTPVPPPHSYPGVWGALLSRVGASLSRALDFAGSLSLSWESWLLGTRGSRRCEELLQSHVPVTPGCSSLVPCQPTFPFSAPGPLGRDLSLPLTALCCDRRWPGCGCKCPRDVCCSNLLSPLPGTEGLTPHFWSPFLRKRRPASKQEPPGAGRGFAPLSGSWCQRKRTLQKVMASGVSLLKLATHGTLLGPPEGTESHPGKGRGERMYLSKERGRVKGEPRSSVTVLRLIDRLGRCF